MKMRLFNPFRFGISCLVCCWLGLAFAWQTSAESVPSAAGGHYTIDTWENDNGLPQNSIISMTQTRDGYLWLGTINGLVRFDGVRFMVFNEDNTPGLGSSPIVSLFEDRRGNLWIGSELSGVLVARDGRVTSMGIGAGNRDSRVRSFCEDAEGAVWMCTRDGQLWRHKDGVANRCPRENEGSGYARER